MGMSTTKIFYFTLQDEQTKEEKLDWFERTRFEQILFDHITPDQKANWINLTDNDFDSFLPLIDKEVKAGKSQEAVFQIFSAGIKTQRDEWVYDFSRDTLIERMKYFVEVYKERLKRGERRELDIKWDVDLERYVERGFKKEFEEASIVKSCCRPYTKQYFYSALEWILDQYKEKKPKDPTIAKLFNTYKFADYKEHVIDLLQRVCTVSVRTMEIIQQMPDTVEHQGG
jgi:predicted helicase